MLIQKTNPVGIDFVIQRLQTFLHTELMATWGMDVNVAAQNKLWECYPLCARNKTATGYVAEVFTAGKDYKEVYWNDKLNVISFFGAGPIETFTNLADKTSIHLVVFCNVKKLKPSIAHRADVEVRKDVQLLAERNMFSCKYISTELYLENVLRDYPNSYRSERLAAVDMQPNHCFRLNFECIYDKNIC